LSLGGSTNESFTFFGEGNNGWGGSDTFCVLDNLGCLTFHQSDTGVSGSQIDTDNGVTLLG
jgi:hypothetical protein